jgi:DNA-binding transcriptional regulator YiaG
MLSNNVRKRQIQKDAINDFVYSLKSNVKNSDGLSDTEKLSMIKIIDDTANSIMQDCVDEDYYYINEFSMLIGVSVSTLRLWDESGKLKPHHRTAGGHRVYSKEQAVKYIIDNC